MLRALSDVSFDVGAGTIHAVLGENGAGKSTLMNVLYGLYRPDDGHVAFDGRQTRIENPAAAQKLGIGMVHQHFMLVPTMTVLENVILGMDLAHLSLNKSRCAAKIRRLIDSFGFNLEVDDVVEHLSVGAQQRVEIVKLLYREAEVLILDEPTSVLTPAEVGPFLNILKRLRNDGKTILFITHKLEEVMSVADWVTVLRAGEVVANLETSRTNKHELARIMIGRDFAEPCEAVGTPGATRLSAHNLCATDMRGVPVLDGLSFELRAGEILGIAGVDGNGQDALADAIVGLLPVDTGTIKLDGVDLTKVSSRERHREHRMGYVPADRHGQAILLSCSVSDNAVLRWYDSKNYCSGRWRSDKKISEYTNSIVRRYDVRLNNIDQTISYLSGGNQQKIVVAREISDGLRVLIVAQPTKGVDIGAIEFIHSELVELRNKGVAIVYISTELELLLEVADRVCVINRGRLSDAMDRKQATPELLGLLMAGASPTMEEAQ